jgi:arylsulfatase
VDRWCAQLPGVSIRYSFDDADAPTRNEIQYHESTRTRGLWRRGWNVAATHGSQLCIGKFDQDRWELYHVDEDRSEARDPAEQYPSRVTELVALWFDMYQEEPASPCGQYTPTTLAPLLSRNSRRPTHGVSFKVLADVDFTADAEGVIFARGSRVGGHALFVRGHSLYNFLGLPPEYRLMVAALTSGRHIVGVEFIRERMGERHETLGTATLHIDDGVVAAANIRTQMRFTLCGRGTVHRLRQWRRGLEPLQATLRVRGRDHPQGGLRRG